MGLREIQLLKELSRHDLENKYNIVRLVDDFSAHNHLCLVFESMGGGNLREVLKKYGARIGLNVKAVKLYAQKLMLSLKGLKKCKILHADIKLDNILVNDTKTSIRLADLGSASYNDENAITPYLVSRFYRAPEISKK
jgi:serine/threonine protein kinase